MSGLPDMVRTLWIISSLWTVQSTQYVKFRLIHPFSVATQTASLGIFLKNDPGSSCRKFGDPFPFEWVFPESKINKMSGFVHLVGKASSLSSMEEAELRNVVVSGIQSWRHSTTHTLFESEFTSYIFIRHGPESTLCFQNVFPWH